MDNELTANLYTPKEVAKITGAHSNTIYRWIREGYLPSVKLGPRRFYVTRATLEELLKGQKIAERTND